MAMVTDVNTAFMLKKAESKELWKKKANLGKLRPYGFLWDGAFLIAYLLSSVPLMVSKNS